MNATYRSGWPAALMVFGLVACQERITAPGVCPEYCPGTNIEVVDSLFAGSILADTTYSGYVSPWGAGTIYLAADPAGTGVRSRGIVRFAALSARLALTSTDTTTAPAATDSLQLQVTIRRRAASATGLLIAVYRLPTSVDTLTAFADLDAYFMDSTRIGSITVPDSLVTGSRTVVVSASEFPGFDAGGRVAAVGLALEGAGGPAFVDLVTVEAGGGASLLRYATIDSAGTPVTRTEGRDRPALDSYLAGGVPAPVPAGLAIGGAPSTRTFLNLGIPAAVLDSSQIVRATIALVPAGPVVGVPGDTLIVLAHAIPADVGPKSPFVPVHPDTVALRATNALVGSSDTLFVDVTWILQRWQLVPSEPRVIVLRATPEGGSFAEVRFGATGTAGAPGLLITYVPPLRFGR